MARRRWDGPPAGRGVVPARRAHVQELVVGDHKAPLGALRYLVEVEAVAAHVPDGAAHLPAVAGAARLGGVLDNHQVMPAGHRHDRVHVRGHALHVHDDDRPGLRGKAAAHILRVEVERVVDVGEQKVIKFDVPLIDLSQDPPFHPFQLRDQMPHGGAYQLIALLSPGFGIVREQAPSPADPSDVT